MDEGKNLARFAALLAKLFCGTTGELAHRFNEISALRNRWTKAARASDFLLGRGDVLEADARLADLLSFLVGQASSGASIELMPS